MFVAMKIMQLSTLRVVEKLLVGGIVVTLDKARKKLDI